MQVNASSDRGSFQLLVRRAEHGIVSNLLCGAAVGESFEFRGPFGVGIYGGFGPSMFQIPHVGEVEAKHVVMVSAGSGITPSLALLRKFASCPSTSTLPEVTLIHCSPSELAVPAVWLSPLHTQQCGS